MPSAHRHRFLAVFLAEPLDWQSSAMNGSQMRTQYGGSYIELIEASRMLFFYRKLAILKCSSNFRQWLQFIALECQNCKKLPSVEPILYSHKKLQQAPPPFAKYHSNSYLDTN